MRQTLSFVIPCYRSEATLAEVVRGLVSTVEADGRFDFEILLVNDNPPDATWRLIERLAASDPRVRGMCMVRNFGQHAALMAGLGAVSGDVAVLLDDDGQTPPCEVFKLVDALSDEVDAVYADYPEAHKYANWFRKLGSEMWDLTARMMTGKPKGLYQSSFIAMKRRVADEVVRYRGPFPNVDGLILRSAGKVVNIPTDHREREVGQSGYSFRKLFSLWMNGFTAFSIKPLRAATCVGAFFALAAIVVAAVMAVRKLAGADVQPGWTSLVVLILLVGGVIILMLGLLGEYVGRLFMSVNGAPQYLVRERANFGEADRAEEGARAAGGEEPLSPRGGSLLSDAAVRPEGGPSDGASRAPVNPACPSPGAGAAR